MTFSKLNIKFSYLYRDGANYKQFNEVIFSNPDNLSVNEIEKAISESLIDKTWFVADEWNLPNQFFDEYMWNNEVDNNWHEFESVKETALKKTENISIKEFLKKIKRKKKKLYV
jgi:hypothetical protein